METDSKTKRVTRANSHKSGQNLGLNDRDQYQLCPDPSWLGSMHERLGDHFRGTVFVPFIILLG